jgi:hypothetical protein
MDGNAKSQAADYSGHGKIDARQKIMVRGSSGFSAADIGTLTFLRSHLVNFA